MLLIRAATVKTNKPEVIQAFFIFYICGLNTDMYTLIIVFFLVSIIFSFLCSVWEAVLLSITPAYVETLKERGSPIGKQLDSFKKDIDRPLAAILTLNTIAHTVGAIGVGAQASKIWGDSIISTMVVPVVMTLAILILSEIIPKTIGASSWKSLAGFTTRSLKVIMYILYPLVWFSELITKSLKKDKDKSVLSRADFTAITKVGEKSGIIAPNESKIIGNLLKFSQVRAKDIMTPRTVVKASDQSTLIGDFYNENKNLRFSRIPIYDGNKDNITGFVLKDKLLSSIIDNKEKDTLGSISRDISVVTEGMNIQQIFDKLMETKEHIALVVDEFGGMSGILTMEDVIETLLGMEIVDELDNVEDMQAMARKVWEKRASELGLDE